MYRFLSIVVMFSLIGCGVETATTAATGAAIKKQEIEDGKKTMDQVQQKVDVAAEQMKQRNENLEK
ncbi:MAG: hypothetical protein JWN94_3662 [Betaproteobacteria bacterium]|nr:hypothetical protein [Betaproteobacteria bacterium]